MTLDFLEWLCEQVQAQGKKFVGADLEYCLPGRVSNQVKTWLCEHNQTVLPEAQTSTDLTPKAHELASSLGEAEV